MNNPVLSKKKMLPATMALIVINVYIFIKISMQGDPGDSSYMVEKGAMWPELVYGYGQWYRLVSACFLHFDIGHLLNNMVMLYAVGRYVERNMGTIRYLIVYLVSGIAGNLASMSMRLLTGDLAVAAGASGAVFGLVGALLAVAVKNGGKVEGLKVSGILLMIALSLFSGLTSCGVDNYAHMGGLAAGFLCGMFLAKKKEREVLWEKNK